jgi:hypothetical protein
MGNGRWDSNAWSGWTASNTAGRSAAQVFTSSGLADEFDPAKIKVRESRDSVDNPLSTPIMVATDVTGSMGILAEVLVRDKLNVLASEIYDRKPVTDPHIMMMAVGDAYCDRAPLQCTQFEADIRLADQTKRLFIEHGGGGNNGESYALPHLFAAFKTETDSMAKRGKKGYLFTVGDEPILPAVTKDQAKRFLGIDFESDISAADCIALASRSFEIFHVVIREGYAKGSNLDHVLRTWQPLLPERVMVLEDHTKIAETIVSAIQVHEGIDKSAVAGSWSGKTSIVVADAIRGLSKRGGQGSGVVRF